MMLLSFTRASLGRPPSASTGRDVTRRCTPRPRGRSFWRTCQKINYSRILEGPLERFTENTIFDPANLKDHTRKIGMKDTGYTVEELEMGLNVVGAPIRRADGAVVGAVSVSGPAFRLPPDALPEIGELSKRGRHRDLPVPGVPGLEPSS